VNLAGNVDNILSCWVIGLGLLLCASCENPAPPDSVVSLDMPSGPVPQWERVIERLERRLQDKGYQSMSSSTERSAFRTTFDAPTYRIHEPAPPHDTYTAEVTLHFTTRYTMTLPSAESREKDAKQQEESDQEKGEQEQPSQEEEDTLARPDDLTAGAFGDLKSDQFAETFDFAYENRRWVLKSEDIGDWFRLIFEDALKAQ